MTIKLEKQPISGKYGQESPTGSMFGGSVGRPEITSLVVHTAVDDVDGSNGADCVSALAQTLSGRERKAGFLPTLAVIKL